MLSLLIYLKYHRRKKNCCRQRRNQNDRNDVWNIV